MEKITKIFILVAFILNSSCYAENLVLSEKISVEYPTPLLISHGGPSLLFKYKDWTLMHETFDPKTFFQQIDLTDLEHEFVKSIFDKEERKKLPEWLQVIAKDFETGLSVTPENITHLKVGDIEIYGVHDKKKNGLIFILDKLAVHHLYVTGAKNKFDLTIHNIKER